jgi:hypothetical protein
MSSGLRDATSNVHAIGSSVRVFAGLSAHARMPTARHGAAAVGSRIFVISGGPRPGGTSSAANEIFVP